MRTIYTLSLLIACLFGVSAWGQSLSVTSASANYSNNFNSYSPTNSTTYLTTMNSTGIGTGFVSTATGWNASSTGTAAYNGQGTGVSATGGYWGYGSVADFSLGALRSTGVGNITYTISFTNNTGATVTSLTLAWDYKQFRYANNSGWDCTGTGQLASNTTLNAQDFTGSATGVNGTPTTTSVPSFTLSGLSIANGQSFGISWVTTDLTGADNGVSIDDFSISVLTSLNPPTLTPAPAATVDAPFNVTFTDDPLWRAAITSVIYNAVVLTAGTDYTISAGQITLIPTGTNPMTIPGNKNLKVKATGYSDATIAQTINSGVPTALTIAIQPAAPTASGGALVTQPVVFATDKYGNNSVGYTINAVVAMGQGASWSLGGTTGVATASNGKATFANLTATNNTAAPFNANITFSYGSVFVTSSPPFTIPAVAPTLTAAPSAIVDAPFSITFTDNASWRAAISSVSYGTTTLTAGTDYTISAGQLTLIPTATNPMSTPGTKTVTVVAAGYNNTAVSQTINAGAPYALTITTQPAAPATYTGVLATQPVVKARDKYNNVVSATYTITAAVTAAQVGNWTLGGTTSAATSSGIATYTNLTATNLTSNAYSATITFSYGSVTVTSNPFVIPAPPPGNDDCSNAITLTPSASPPPVAGTLVSAAPSTGLSTDPTSNDVWYKFTTTCTALHTVAITFANGAKIDFEVFTGSCPTSGAATFFGLNHAGGITTQTKTQTIAGSTLYYIRVIDYGGTAPVFNITVTVNAPLQPSAIAGNAAPCFGNIETYSVTPIAGVTYAWAFPGAGWSGSSTTNSINATVGSTSGNITVTPSNGCGLTGPSQTLAVVPVTAPTDVTGVSVNPGNGRLTMSWTNPADCYDEIMVVATDNSGVTLVPTGDGSQYKDTSMYASITPDNNVNMNPGEYCIYKGTSTAVVMTDLLNTNIYKIKIFTRWGTLWSAGVQVTGTPIAVSTGEFKSVKSGLWTDNTVWNKYVAGSWVATSGVGDYPNNYTSDVTIETGTIVKLDSSLKSVHNLTVKTAGQLWTADLDTTKLKYIGVYGDITCNGTIGNANPNTSDNICFAMEGNPSVISGTGLFGCSRMTKRFDGQDPGGSNTTNLNINMNINLYWVGTALFNYTTQSGFNTFFNVTLNTPYKVTLKNSQGSVAIDGTTGRGAYLAAGKFTINGTLTIPGALYLTTNNGAAGSGCTFEIGTTGIVNTAIAIAAASGSATHTLNIKNGGLLNITDTAGFAQYSAVNNYITLGNTSTVQYSAPSATQTVLSGQTYGNLVIGGSGTKNVSSAYTNLTVNGNLAVNTGNTFNLNGKLLYLNGTVSGIGTITGSATSSISIGPGTTLTSTPLGVLRFTAGHDSLNTLTMDRMMKPDSYPNHKFWAAVLGSNLNVASLKLNQGILATNTYLLTLQNYNAGDYATYNKASYVATTDTLATAFTVGNTFSGTYGFRIKGVKAGTPAYFPVGADFISPNRAMVNLNTGATTRDLTVVLTKGDIGYTGSPRVNRIWYMYSSVADSVNANMQLYYTGYDLATYPYLTKQDELETGFLGLRVRLLEKANMSDRYFTNISNGSDTMVNFSPGTEVYAKYTKSVSTIYNGTKPGIFRFSVFSIVDGDFVVLPVSFTAIRAYQQGTGININWSVASEINIDHYEVERAGDGRLFSTVATQPARNSTAGNSYTAADVHPLTGTNYYRIKAIGKDGQVLYSTVVNITLGSDGKASLLVYPNPVKNNHCNVQLGNLAAGKYNLAVYSMGGQLIGLQQIEHAGGSSSQKLYLPAGTAAGIYVVKLTGQNVYMQTSVFVSRK